MSWLRIDDGFVENAKIADLGDRAFRLHVAGLCYCARNLTDGFLSKKAAKIVQAAVSASRRHVDELVAAGVWLPEDDGSFQIHDFTVYNPKSEKVKADRARNAERQARHRNAESNALRNGVTNAAPSRPLKSKGLSVVSYEPPEPVSDEDRKARAVELRAFTASEWGVLN